MDEQDPGHSKEDAPTHEWRQISGGTIVKATAQWDADPRVPRTVTEAFLRSRDRRRYLAALALLGHHHYLTTSQLQILLWPSTRAAQLGLRTLEDWRLVTRWRQQEPRPAANWRKHPDIFLLAARGASVLALSSRDDPKPLIRRAWTAFNYSFHIHHALETNGFFVGLVEASAGRPDQGLHDWVGDDAMRRNFQDLDLDVSPDGWGRYLASGREVTFHLEWDKGTEGPQRLRQKAAALVRARAGNVLWVMPGAARERFVRSWLARGAGPGDQARYWTTHGGLLAEAGPLAAIFLPLGGATGPGQSVDGAAGARQRLADLPGAPGTERRADDCLGRPRWWSRRSR